MLALIEASSLGLSNLTELLGAAAHAGADALIIDGEIAGSTWTAWSAVLRNQTGPRPRLVPRVAVELPLRAGAARDWRPVLALEENPTVILRVRSTDNFDHAYRDAIAALQPLVSELVRAGAHPIFEPVGTLVRSREVWCICEAIDQDAGPSAMTVAWRPLAPTAMPETPSVAIMRLARALQLIFLPPLPPESALPQPAEGEGKAWIPLPANGDPATAYFVIEQLKGMCFDGDVCLVPAKGGAFSADELRAAITALRAEWAKPPIALSAYKGDKNAPRFVKPGAASAVIASATAEPAQ